MLLKTIRFSVALLFLFVMLYLGRLVSIFLPIGIPDSIWGLLILFVLLVSNAVKISWIMPATRPMLRYMTVFFLPVCAGIIEQIEPIKSHLHSLLLANFISSVLSLILLGILAQWLFKQVEADDE